ncbi:ATP-binding protein [Leclercia adecarboxylata]|uniref:ATP-binding protein n=1 Tax=Leclercia adecarboxylata TaxID=83655 RepID=UPI001F372AC5|nr:ATP-binding protein [Leclercia adecarboxylata]MCE9983908.1 ATP-binding protein [Leclercia adecarboxylata]
MRLWPRSLHYRLLLIVLVGLLLANGLSLTLVMAERMSSVRNVMLGNLQDDVSTSVAILDRLPASERAQWLPRLDRDNYHYVLGPGEPGAPPADARSRDAVRTLTDTLATQYPLRFTAVPGPVSHIQAHLTLHDGSPLTLDLTPRMPPVARWLPVVFIIQLLLVVICAWLAVRQVVRPFTRFTRAVDTLEPTSPNPLTLTEQGPLEVRHAARAFNAMQARIQTSLKERAQILAAISHDLQTPITRMRLRVEMADQPELRDKLTQDLDSMTRLVREGIDYARSSGVSPEPVRKVDLYNFIDTLVCDYADTGKNVHFAATRTAVPFATRAQALHRILTNLLDNALKFGDTAEVTLTERDERVLITVEDNGPGIPDDELAAVLQPFYRVESSRNRETGGTGLGLAIAAQLTAQLDGQLQLTNRPEGGLCARITLPVV